MRIIGTGNVLHGRAATKEERAAIEEDANHLVLAKQLRHFTMIFEKDGMKSLLRSKRKLTRRLNEHLEAGRE